jgi:hypothetical protein
MGPKIPNPNNQIPAFAGAASRRPNNFQLSNFQMTKTLMSAIRIFVII